MRHAVSHREREDELSDGLEVCKYCGKTILAFPVIPSEGLQWKHSDGFYNCGGQNGHAETYAEPKDEPRKGKVN